MELADRPPLLRAPYWQVSTYGGEPYMPDPTPWLANFISSYKVIQGVCPAGLGHSAESETAETAA